MATSAASPPPAGLIAACDVLQPASDAAEHEAHAEHHEPSGHDHDGPARTCCELTGKANVILPAPFASDAPPPIALAALRVEPITADVAALEVRGSLSRAHAPPAYLRNSALRI